MQAKMLLSQIGGRNRVFEGADVGRGLLPDSALLILFDMCAIELPAGSAAAQHCDQDDDADHESWDRQDQAGNCFSLPHEGKAGATNSDDSEDESRYAHEQQRVEDDRNNPENQTQRRGYVFPHLAICVTVIKTVGVGGVPARRGHLWHG